MITPARPTHRERRRRMRKTTRPRGSRPPSPTWLEFGPYGISSGSRIVATWHRQDRENARKGKDSDAIVAGRHT